MNSRVSSLSCVQVQLYWLLEHCDYSVVRTREQEENNAKVCKCTTSVYAVDQECTTLLLREHNLKCLINL